MATILLINCNRLVSGVQYLGISSIAAFVKRAGHKVVFFDTANYTNNRSPESYKVYRDRKAHIGLELKSIKNKNAMPLKRLIATLLGDLENELTKQRIDLIGFSSFSDDWPFALFLIRKVHAVAPKTPIIVGGVHATVAPEQVIKHREISMVCVGEGEMAIVELLNAIQTGRIELSIKNLWIKYAGKLIKNSMRPLLTYSDDLPILDWSLYNDTNFFYPYDGTLYRRGSVFMGRGCPYSCNFCINSFLRQTYNRERGKTRLKSTDYIIKEIAFLKKKYDIQFLKFWDETFLSMPKKYLSEFAETYKNEIMLPFTIETTANTINNENVEILANMGCQSVSIGVETSNENLRMNILNKPITNEAYERCFKLLSEHGLRKVANFMFFLPHQTLNDMWQDVYLCKRWSIDSPSARIFYPYQGTVLRDYCIKNDMIDIKLLERIENENAISEIDYLNESYITFQDTVLNFDDEIKKEGKLLLDNFILFQESKESDYANIKELLLRDDTNANDALIKMEREIYVKRFKEEPS